MKSRKNIEKFVLHYRSKCNILKECLDKNHKFVKVSSKYGFTSTQFSQRLMLQLTFLYWLEKEGWLGVKMLPNEGRLSEGAFKKIYKRLNIPEKRAMLKAFPNKIQGSRTISAYPFQRMTSNDWEKLLLCFIGSDYDRAWGTGSKTFIRDEFNNCVNHLGKNFFNDFLNPIFYNALNNKKEDSYCFKGSPQLINFCCKLPIIRSGLFEPLMDYDWKRDRFSVPNSFFLYSKGGTIKFFEKHMKCEGESFRIEDAIDIIFSDGNESSRRLYRSNMIDYLAEETGESKTVIERFVEKGDWVGRPDCCSKADEALKNIWIDSVRDKADILLHDKLIEITNMRSGLTPFIVKRYESEEVQELVRENRNLNKMKRDIIKNAIDAIEGSEKSNKLLKLKFWLSMFEAKKMVNPEGTKNYKKKL